MNKRYVFIRFLSRTRMETPKYVINVDFEPPKTFLNIQIPLKLQVKSISKISWRSADVRYSSEDAA